MERIMRFYKEIPEKDGERPYITTTVRYVDASWKPISPFRVRFAS